MIFFKKLKSLCGERLFVSSMLIILFTLCLTSMQHKNLHVDEMMHLDYGMKILNGNPDRDLVFFDSKMPFSVFNTLPRLKSDLVKYRVFSNEPNSRIVTVLFSLVLGVLIYFWARKLYGPYAAALSLFIYVLSPDILANSQLISTDLYAALMATATFFAFWLFLNKPTWIRMLWSAVILGIAQLAKYSATFFYPILLVIVAIKAIPFIRHQFAQKSYLKIIQRTGSFAICFLLYITISIVIINAGFRFSKNNIPLGDYVFENKHFKTMQSKLSWMGKIPVPLPYAYLQGLDMVKQHEEKGMTFGPVYALGRVVGRGERIPYYYFLAFLLKVPIATQILLFFALVYYLKNKTRFSFLMNEIFLFAPILFFFIYFDFFYSAQIGIRHLIIIYPFIFIFCGRLLRFWPSFKVPIKILIFLLLGYQVVSVLSYHPHYLSYFNELLWDRTKAYKIFADSNIDYGQNNWYLKEYEKEHPEAHILPKNPVSGKIVVNVQKLVGTGGVFYTPEEYQWLRENFEPTGHIAYSYLIYDVSPEALAKVVKKEKNLNSSKRIP